MNKIVRQQPVIRRRRVGSGATAETGTQYGGAAKKVIRDRAISVSDEVSFQEARWGCRWRVEGGRWWLVYP